MEMRVKSQQINHNTNNIHNIYNIYVYVYTLQAAEICDLYSWHPRLELTY